MAYAQKRQKSWFSSLLGSRSATESPSSETTREATNGATLVNSTETTTPTSKPRVGFSVPSVASPESPVKRASPSLLAQRKIFERPTATPNKLTSGTPKVSNFGSASTPRNMFRSSTRDGPNFTFTPRVPPNTLKGSFPPATPGRSFRSSTAELSGRGMAKITSSHDLFQMKIPEPDSALTGEAITKQVPKDANRTGSIYANEYLAHLCPPEFNEVQRNQFFCILDLRRLKYAADEIFFKKDWKLNILNFAKEYEKSRSLIMLRYGLFEFKTVKISKEVFQKWKSENNVPDTEEEEEDEEDAPRALPSASKINGTAGILRSGKRKADDDLQPKASLFAPSAQSKRLRPAEREPLAETTTPTLNKSANATSKRKADSFGEEHEPRAAPPPPKSASRTFLEKVANTPRKEPPAVSASDTPSALKPKANAFSQSSKPTSNSLARSLFDNGLKSSSGRPAPPGNIFGYLSDASSAKGAADVDADGEETDESEQESEAQEASQSDEPSVAASRDAPTPQPSSQTAASLFASKQPAAVAGSSASSEAGEAPTGRSIFDRINKDSDGQPIRMFPTGSETPRFGSAAPSDSGAAAASDKEAEAPAANKTWSPDTPIKFAASSSQPSAPFGGALASKPSSKVAPVTGFSFGSTAAKSSETPGPKAVDSTAPKSIFPSSSAFPATTSGSATANMFASAVSKPAESTSTTTTFPFGQPTSAEIKPAKETPKPATNMFAQFPKPAETPAPAAASPAKSLFNNADKADKPEPAQTTATLFFNKPAESESSAPTPASQGASPFGNTSMPNGSLFQTSTSTPAAPAAPAAPASEPAKTSLFPSSTSTSQPSVSLFKFPSATPGAISQTQTAPSTEQKPLFPAAATPAAPSGQTSLFNSSTTPAPDSQATQSQTEPAKSQPSFPGGAAAAPSASFNFGNTQSATPPPAAPFSFGSTAAQPDASKPAASSLFGNNANGGSSAGSSFNFTPSGVDASQSFNNPFATGGNSNLSQGISFDFGGSQPAGGSSGTPSFTFGGGGGDSAPAAAPAFGGGGSAVFSFGGGSQQASGASTPTGNMFGGAPGSSAPVFNFGGGGNSQSAGTSMFGQQQQPAAGGGGGMFNLAPPMGGMSTGTNTPFTLGGASSLATTPATGTPEPGATQEQSTGQQRDGQNADEGEEKQAQINLTEGGPGEEDEAVVHEVRAKALKLKLAKGDGSDDEPAKDSKKSPWATMGVGPLRLLKHKTTGAVRILLRAEPRGHVALNKIVLPSFSYKPEPGGKYVKLTTSNDKGDGLETWMLQVKTKEFAQALADALEANKDANKT